MLYALTKRLFRSWNRFQVFLWRTLGGLRARGANIRVPVYLDFPARVRMGAVHHCGGSNWVKGGVNIISNGCIKDFPE